MDCCEDWVTWEKHWFLPVSWFTLYYAISCQFWQICSVGFYIRTYRKPFLDVPLCFWEWSLYSSTFILIEGQLRTWCGWDRQIWLLRLYHAEKLPLWGTLRSPELFCKTLLKGEQYILPLTFTLSGGGGLLLASFSSFAPSLYYLRQP